ncbi:hypothetical protein NQ318_000851 [Aromia moschata]|uniref:Pentraxin (PTX) domain-containing protein n=1 Tax=Aromia moschata TaxID=1265417 RepID=A0AAV8XC31_9CUCU|nr:hypothetical protein NQ318_000851 [Aromia moschata]
MYEERLLGVCLAVALAAATASAVVHDAGAWHPFQQAPAPLPGFGGGFLDHGGGFGHQHVDAGDECEVYKVGFTQDLYFQYVRYKSDVPDLKQFTLCFWSKFYNHTNDHPIFSYAGGRSAAITNPANSALVDGQPRAIYSWVANTARSSYFSLAVEGHTFYRLNYPLRLNKWYHTCQSWNGKTGEWQIWVNAERVGRGFHNRLVGDIIQGGGIAISGQEQSQLGGGFQEGEHAPKGSGGMLGEITMVQFYSRQDDNHPRPDHPRQRPTLPYHPLLTGGQINRKVKINFGGGQPQLVPAQNFDVQYLNGQLVGDLVSQQLSQAQGVAPQTFLRPHGQQQLSLPLGPFSSQFVNLGNRPPAIGGDLSHDLQTVQFLDNTKSQLETHNLFKRQNADDKAEGGGEKTAKKRASESKHAKRELYLGGGTIVEEPVVGAGHGGDSFEQALLHGLAGIGQNRIISQQQKQTEDEREPAEAEVKAVLNICAGCDPEPFDKALVFGWRTVPKKLYSGAFYTLATPQCKSF